MSNEELAVKIQEGRTELYVVLWPQIEKFVRYMAKRLFYKLPASAGVELDDLVNSGFIALVDAVRYFDPTQGYTLITYLTTSLKSAFADATGYRTVKRRNDPLVNPSTRSFDEPLSDDPDGETRDLYDVTADPFDYFEDLETRLYFEQLHRELEAALSHVSKDHSELLRQRYYFDRSLQDIGNERGVSRERVRQIEYKALRSIRKTTICQRLKEYRIDLLTPFYTSVGVRQYQNTHTSATEKAVLRREKLREEEAIREAERLVRAMSDMQAQRLIEDRPDLKDTIIKIRNRSKSQS